MSFDRERMKERAAELAAAGVFIGTSSWKYEGWLGQLYSPRCYEYRDKFSRARFQNNCLKEYAEVFRTVCVDAAYYAFPRREYLRGLAEQVPDGFRFGFKVTDEITVRRFPNLPRFGTRAGQSNGRFLDADLFAQAFLEPCESIRPKVGVCIFEFSKFHRSEYEHGRDFVADLDAFLGRLPRGWPYAVELRNRAWLVADYFACLARHRIAHVFNSWEAMPPVDEQMAMPGSRSSPEVAAARFLLKPGRRYEEAVKAFQPYTAIKEANEAARKSGAALMLEGLHGHPGRKTYLFVNNRLEGSALATINAMVALLESQPR